MAFPGQVTTSVISKEIIERRIVSCGVHSYEETTWEIKMKVTTPDGYTILNGVTYAKHDHKIVTTHEITRRPVAHGVHYGGHHISGPHVMVSPPSPFPGLNPTPGWGLVLGGAGGPSSGFSSPRPDIDPAVLLGLRPPVHRTW
jgi:hypothetical protein